MTVDMKMAVKTVTQVVAETALDLYVTENRTNPVLLSTIAALFANDNRILYTEITTMINNFAMSRAENRPYFIDNRIIETTEQFVEYLSDKFLYKTI
jgi:hypothetical protein